MLRPRPAGAAVGCKVLSEMSKVSGEKELSSAVAKLLLKFVGYEK